MPPSSAPPSAPLESADRPEVLAWIIINDPAATKELLAGAPIEDFQLHRDCIPMVRYIAELVELAIPRLKAEASHAFPHNEAQLHEVFTKKTQQYLEGHIAIPRTPNEFHFAMWDALTYMPLPNGD